MILKEDGSTHQNVILQDLLSSKKLYFKEELAFWNISKKGKIKGWLRDI